MKFPNGDPVHIYPAADEKPHAPPADELWQESFVLYWYDMAQNVGGNFRLSREPNHKGGQSQFNIVLVTPEGTYRRVSTSPVGAEHVFDDGISNGDGSLRYAFDGQHIRWTLKDPEAEADLLVELTVPPIDAHRKAGMDNAEAILSAHVDAACHVTGTMRVQGRTYQVNAMGVRDHAWGMRDLSALRSYRWLVTDFGEAGSSVSMTFLSANQTLARFGWVVRGDQVTLAKQVSIQALVAEDGAANCGGTVRMELTTGELFEARFEPMYPAIALDLTFVHAAYYHDTFCRVTWGEQVGFGIFESANNVRGGQELPTVFHGSVGANGWHPEARLLGTQESTWK